MSCSPVPALFCTRGCLVGRRVCRSHLGCRARWSYFELVLVVWGGRSDALSVGGPPWRRSLVARVLLLGVCLSPVPPALLLWVAGWGCLRAFPASPVMVGGPGSPRPRARGPPPRNVGGRNVLDVSPYLERSRSQARSVPLEGVWCVYVLVVAFVWVVPPPAWRWGGRTNIGARWGDGMRWMSLPISNVRGPRREVLRWRVCGVCMSWSWPLCRWSPLPLGGGGGEDEHRRSVGTRLAHGSPVWVGDVEGAEFWWLWCLCMWWVFPLRDPPAGGGSSSDYLLLYLLR